MEARVGIEHDYSHFEPGHHQRKPLRDTRILEFPEHSSENAPKQANSPESCHDPSTLLPLSLQYPFTGGRFNLLRRRCKAGDGAMCCEEYPWEASLRRPN